MENYSELPAADKRLALFDACIEQGAYLSVGHVAERYRNNAAEAVLIYRHPNLVAQGLEVHVHHQSWMTREDGITYTLASYYPYDYPNVNRATYAPKLNSVRISGENIDKAVATILAGVVARRRAVAKGKHSSAVASLNDERIASGYILGISDQVNEALNIDAKQKLTSDGTSSQMEIRPGLEIHIAKMVRRGYRLLITIKAQATQEDILSTVHLLMENGYNIYRFAFEQPSTIRHSYVMVSMYIDDEYRPEVFNLIESTRLFQRQIVNEIEELSKK